MTQSDPLICPHLGMAGDSASRSTGPDALHRCYAQEPPGKIEQSHQATSCLGPAHTSCRFYRPLQPGEGAPAGPTIETPPVSSQWSRLALLAVPALLLLVVVGVYARDLLRPPASASATPVPTVVPLAIAGNEGATAAKVADAVAQGETPSPTPGGRVVTIAPQGGAVGWWSSGQGRPNLGDSYLYAGYFEGQVFASSAQFDLRQIPRGAPVEDASLTLTGLDEGRFRPEAGGTWTVQLLSVTSLPDPSRANFQALVNAPAAVTLFPTLYPADLGMGKVNRFTFDRAAREWLAQQIASGAGSVIVRITGPAGGADSLFAWDSGTGPATGGEPPLLELRLGASPATPPPLPTEVVIVVILTPTPENVLTAAAEALTATWVATTEGTPTPLPYRAVTATPKPANLATVQAQRYAMGLPPFVIYTLTPANAATAAAYAAVATAIAVTTGTFTPVPADAVTPVIVLPTPLPENVVTAAAQALRSAAQAAKLGTPTRIPPDALIATRTRTPMVIVNPPKPDNAETAVARVVMATAIAITTGTYTPLPDNIATATWTPQPTPLPLLVAVTPLPPPTPTATPPSAMPAQLAGKILFRSDRAGQAQLYALDPNSKQILWVTQSWPFALAQAGEGRSPDGQYSALMQDTTTNSWNDLYQTYNTTKSVQVFVHDNQYNTARQLTSGNGMSYDAAWSPRGDRIAYVSTQPGNDEIFTVNPDGSDVRRLTTNTWEWDKHPSWSPDGSQIVFWSNRDSGRRQLWVMNADGGNPRLLLESPYNDWDPIWVK